MRSGLKRTTLAITQTRIRDYSYFCVTCPKPGGGRSRRFFKDRRLAQTFFEQCKIQLQNHGLAAFSLSESLRIEALECSDKLIGVGSTLREATAFLLDHVRNIRRSSTTEAVICELLAARKADGCSKRYLDDLRVRLGRFGGEFGQQMIAAISGPEIDDWLRSLPVGGVTRNTFRRRLSTLFCYARKRNYTEANPIENVERAKEVSAPVGILSPDEIERLLENAQPAMVPYWAIGAFAGLRTAEIQRLTWGDVDLVSGYIEIKAANSKTASRRLVTIQPNLRAWLIPHSLPRGAVTPSNFQVSSKLDRDRAALLAAWPNNALRHSFASYHLAAFGDAAKLALEMGSSPRMIFKHYRELVRPSAASKYWSIWPNKP